MRKLNAQYFLSLVFFLVCSRVSAQVPQPPVQEDRDSVPVLPEFDSSPEGDFEVEPPQLPIRPPLVNELNVVGFTFEGNTVVSTNDLEAAVKPFIGRTLTQSDLYDVESTLTELYAQRGYITSVALIDPSQNPDLDREEVVLKVTLVEGQLNEVTITGAKRLRRFVRKRLNATRNGVVNQDALLSSFRRLTDSPLIESLALDSAATIPLGKSNLNVDIKAADAHGFSVGIDNSRPPTIGTLQQVARYRHLNPLGRGGILNLSYGRTGGSNNVAVGYQIPFNSMDGTFRFDYQYAGGRIIEEPFDELDFRFNTHFFNFGVRQPLLQRYTNTGNQEFALGLNLTHENSNLSSPLVPFAISPGSEPDGDTNISAVRFSQEWLDRRSKSVFLVRSQISVGLPIFSTDNPQSPDSEFVAWKGQLLWGRKISQNLTFRYRSELQFADRPLVPSEQFTAGGSSAVRGLRQSSFPADQGFLNSMELDIRAFTSGKHSLNVSPFLDVATTWNNSSPLVDAPNTFASLGLGLQYRFGRAWSVGLVYAFPFINRPDQGGSLQENGVTFNLSWNGSR